MSLLVIVPTRGRVAACAALAAAFTTTAADLLLVVDADDLERDRYLDLTRPGEVISDGTGAVITARPAVDVMVVAPPRDTFRGMARALNEAAVEHCGGYDYLGFMGDDHRPRTPDWDTAVVRALEREPSSIVYGNDLVQGPNLPTAVFMDARIVRALGRMVPERQVHLFLDNYWKDLGQALGTLRYLPDVVIEHVHPITGKVDWDEGHVRVNDTALFSHDQRAYERFVYGGGLIEDVSRLRALGEAP